MSHIIMFDSFDIRRLALGFVFPPFFSTTVLGDRINLLTHFDISKWAGGHKNLTLKLLLKYLSKWKLGSRYSVFILSPAE